MTIYSHFVPMSHRGVVPVSVIIAADLEVRITECLACIFPKEIDSSRYRQLSVSPTWRDQILRLPFPSPRIRKSSNGDSQVDTSNMFSRADLEQHGTPLLSSRSSTCSSMLE